jgi:REP element-mobilizing transposase RayT
MPQSLSSILIHLVYSTKDRYPFLTPEVEPEIYAYQSTIFRALDCPALAMNGTSDHLHVLFRLSRTRTIAEIVEEVKANSSKWIKSKGGLLEKFFWQRGYGAFSIGESRVKTLKAYIAQQKEHHRQKSFQDEFRLFLQRYRIDYDEHYVWD